MNHIRFIGLKNFPDRLLETEVNNKDAFKALMAKLDELQLSEISQLKR